MDFYNQKGNDSNINQLLYANNDDPQHDSENQNQFRSGNPVGMPTGQVLAGSSNQNKMAQLQKIREQQKMQYLNKKKNMLGDKVGNAMLGKLLQNADGNSLDQMNLDRSDQIIMGDAYDPFFKSNKMDLELQAQMNIMNKANTHGNKMWAPEYQQQLEQQRHDELNDLEEIQDTVAQPDNIRYYKPQAMGFTQAEPQAPQYQHQNMNGKGQEQQLYNEDDDNSNVYGQMYQGGVARPIKKQQFIEQPSEDTSQYKQMNVVEMQDGKKHAPKKGAFNEVIDNTHIEGETTIKEQVQQFPGMQFDAQVVDESLAGGAKKKKKKKKKTTAENDEQLTTNQYEETVQNEQSKTQNQQEEENIRQEQAIMRAQLEKQKRDLDEQQRQLDEMKRKEQQMRQEEEKMRLAQAEAAKRAEEERIAHEKSEALRRQMEQLKLQQQLEQQQQQLQAQQNQQQQLSLQNQQQNQQQNSGPQMPTALQMQQMQQQYQLPPNAPGYYYFQLTPEMRIDPREAHNMYIQKLTNPFTSVEELRDLFMMPVPPNVGQILCTIVRHKSGFNRLWPKYTLHLSDSNKFLLNGKKRSGNTTSNYMITLDQEKMKKGTNGYLGKVRSNFLGTEFYLYDDKENPKKAKDAESVRREHGTVEYETNVLGSKGPRRMKVLLPMVDAVGQQYIYKSVDGDNLISKISKEGKNENLMFFFNKPPKWNEQVQAFVLNFNGRVDKASVKNFQLIDEFDDNRIHMQFGRIGKQNFNMDVAFPFSIFQAFGIALSSFDFKFACE